MSRGQPSRQKRWAGAVLAAAAGGLAATACAASVPNPVRSGVPATAEPSPGATTPASVSTDSAAHPAAPLTDLPLGSAADAARRAVVFMVAGSSPRGLSAADVVFQEFSAQVRYLAVFQSRQATGVGPITGTQPSDAQAISVLHPLAGYNGGTAIFVKILDHSAITDVGYASHPLVYRATSQGLTGSTTAALHRVPGKGAPPPLFRFSGQGSGGSPLATTGVSHPASVRVTIPGYGQETWSFSSRSHRWTLERGGPRVAVANLVVQLVAYKQSFVSHRYGITVPTPVLIGTGRAEVFSGSAGGSQGIAAVGHWSKPHIGEVTNYFDDTGYPMAFQPGPSWVILAPPGTGISTSGNHR